MYHTASEDGLEGRQEDITYARRWNHISHLLHVLLGDAPGAQVAAHFNVDKLDGGLIRVTAGGGSS